MLFLYLSLYFSLFLEADIDLSFVNTKKLSSSNRSYIFANVSTDCFVTVFIFFAIVQQPRAKHSNIWDQNNIINMSSLSLGEKKIQQHLAAFIYYTSSADTSTIKMSAFKAPALLVLVGPTARRKINHILLTLLKVS